MPHPLIAHSGSLAIVYAAMPVQRGWRSKHSCSTRALSLRCVPHTATMVSTGIRPEGPGSKHACSGVGGVVGGGGGGRSALCTQ